MRGNDKRIQKSTNANNQVQRVPVGRRSAMLSPWFDNWALPRWMDDFFETGLLGDARNELSFSPAVDVDETDQEYLVHMDLPGVEEENINVDCSGDQITVSATRREETREGGRAGRRERFYGTYQRTFSIPSEVDAEKITAECHNGVLTLTLPKGEGAQRRRIPIGRGTEQGRSKREDQQETH